MSQPAAAVIFRTPMALARRRGLGAWVSPWSGGAVAVAALVLLPVLAVAWLALHPSDDIWSHLSSTVLPVYVSTTLWLMLGVGIGTLVIGVSTAWLVSVCEFPGRRLFQWALLLPFAMPGYLIAYTYTDLLDYAGPAQRLLRDIFGWSSARDYWFPPIRSLGGAIAMLTLVLYPYVYMLSRAAFLEQSPHLTDICRSLGKGSWAAFFKVSLPIARPAIAVGVALVLMETLNDFGTVHYFAVYTLTAGLYDVWLNMGNLAGAAQIACVMLGFVVALVSVERASRRRQRYFLQGTRRFEAPARYRLTGARACGAVMACLLPLALGFLVPGAVLLVYGIQYFDVAWSPGFRRFAFNSLMLSTTAAVLALALGTFLAYSRRLHGDKPAVALAARLAGLGYAVPGTVMAVGVIVPFAAFDNSVDAFMRAQFGVSTGLLLSGTVFAVVFAYLVRFLAVSLGAVESSLGKVTPSMDMAARSLGKGPWATLRQVHLPLISSGLFSGALVVFVDCMKELPATLLLRPFNFDTLATHVYQYASDEQLGAASLSGLMIVVAGLLPVIVLSRTIASGRR